MGIAEIQAALAANRSNGPASNPFAANQAHTAQVQAFAVQPVAAPSPFAAPTAVANPFGGSAPTPFAQPNFALPPQPTTAPAPAATAAPFAFNPPPGFNPAGAPPINPPGERASLNSVVAAEPAPTPFANGLTTEQAGQAIAAAHAPATAEPKRRGRKPKAETLLEAVAESPSVPMHRQADAEQALASPAEVVLSSISTEDLVALLRDRGYTVILESKA